MQVNMSSSLHNKFEFQLINSEGVVTQEVTAYNLVTDSYYTRSNRSGDGVTFSNIVLGTGTGEVSTSDTALFNQIASKSSGISSGNITYVDVNQFSVQSVVTFTEAEAIGLITEVGLRGNNTLYTHAMVTDAEGHQISINKTDTDRLIITITLYLTISLPDTMVPYQGIGSTAFSWCGDQKRYTAFSDGDIHFFVRKMLGCSDYRWIDAGTLGLAVSPKGGTGSYNGGYDNNFSWGLSASDTPNGIRYQNNGRVLSADWNLPGTYQIYGFNTPIGHIPITSDIFPPLPLTLSEVADGTSTGFNFKIPRLMSDVKVYIDDVLQPANSYTWNGIDYVNTFQSWETTQADKLLENPAEWNSDYYNFGRVHSLIFNSSWHANSNERFSTDTMIFDFGAPQQFTRAYKPEANRAYSDWQYSDDNENWTTLTIPASDANIYDLPEPITARYLKTTNATSADWSNSWTPTGHTHLCCFKNQLEFNTAPLADAVVKVEAKSAYPIKNSNWLFDQFVLDFTISRA